MQAVIAAQGAVTAGMVSVGRTLKDLWHVVPVGLNLFIASYRFEKPIMTVYAATFPFLIILAVSVLIIMYFPGLSLLLVPD